MSRYIVDIKHCSCKTCINSYMKHLCMSVSVYYIIIVIISLLYIKCKYIILFDLFVVKAGGRRFELNAEIKT